MVRRKITYTYSYLNGLFVCKQMYMRTYMLTCVNFAMNWCFIILQICILDGLPAVFKYVSFSSQH